VLALAWALLFQVSVVRGSSMNPGIHDGDRILIEPWSYLVSDVERGDVVVLRYPLDPQVDYIKRVVGLPGDHVRLEAGRVWVNGKQLEEPYVERADDAALMELVVRNDTYFVLGDNRGRSSDSRDFGAVPATHLRGRVDVRLWPPSRIGLIR
jgi:signal peptidase I